MSHRLAGPVFQSRPTNTTSAATLVTSFSAGTPFRFLPQLYHYCPYPPRQLFPCTRFFPTTSTPTPLTPPRFDQLAHHGSLPDYPATPILVLVSPRLLRAFMLRWRLSLLGPVLLISYPLPSYLIQTQTALPLLTHLANLFNNRPTTTDYLAGFSTARSIFSPDYLSYHHNKFALVIFSTALRFSTS